VRRELSIAALREGKRVGTFEDAHSQAAKFSGFDETTLGDAMRAAEEECHCPR
jgi:hypothetical protein